MKKSLTALAVLGAFAGSAFAGGVSLYGVVDTGLAYTHGKTEGVLHGFEKDGRPVDTDLASKGHEFRMDSGNNSGSRFGLKGTETLGNGLTVGFVLENGFTSDDGAFSTDDRLFDREATLSLSGDFGSVYAGRMGTLVSDSGSVGFYAGMASAFGTGWSANIAGHSAVMANFTTRYDNTIAYVSPEFAGTRFYAQYAMGDTNENKHGNDRYAALGAEWKGGPVALGFLVDMLDKDASKDAAWDKYDAKQNDTKLKDAYTLNVAGSYDCGAATTYLALQYFKDARDAGSVLDTLGVFDESFWEGGEAAASVKFAKAAYANTGYGVHLSTAFDAVGGAWKAGIGYMDADVDFGELGRAGSTKAYTASVGYEYALSKRTKLYSGAGYVKREADLEFGQDQKGSYEQEAFDVVAGLVHTF